MDEMKLPEQEDFLKNEAEASKVNSTSSGTVELIVNEKLVVKNPKKVVSVKIPKYDPR